MGWALGLSTADETAVPSAVQCGCCWYGKGCLRGLVSTCVCVRVVGMVRAV